jgi:hypothetical protein
MAAMPPRFICPEIVPEVTALPDVGLNDTLAILEVA